MLSQAKIKFIRSLAQRKFRDKHKLFIAEGSKLVCDCCSFITPTILVSTAEWAKEHEVVDTEHIVASLKEIKKISLLNSPPPVLAIFPQWQTPLEWHKLFDQHLTLLLDGIQDPGNMGNIIRTAHWFGIKNIICSTNTVEVYNPKVVQGSMGALAHVRVHYKPLDEVIRTLQTKDIPCYGAFMEGESVFESKLSSPAALVMGNEGQGISPTISMAIDKRISIPSYASGDAPESLNVSSATAILCAQLTSRSFV